MRFTRFVVSLLVAGASVASGLAAQAPVLSTGSCSAPIGGTIVGQIVSDSTGMPVRGTEAGVAEPACAAVPDSAGRFVLAHVPAGVRNVHAATPRMHGHTTLRVREGDTVRVEVRVWPDDLVRDCAHDVHCAPLLAPPPAQAVQGISDDARLREAADRTTIVLAGVLGEMLRRGWVPCLAEPDARVRNLVRARFPNLVRSTACGMRTGNDTLSYRPHMRHLPSGRPAFVAGVDSTTRDGDHAVVRSHYLVGPLWAEGWECRFDRVGSDWIPRSCEQVWIS